jgi:ferredoxin
LRIELDRELCQGHGRCYGLAPDLFDSDDEGYAVLLCEGGIVPAGQEGTAQLAADNCPEFAISVEIDDHPR